VIDTVYSQLCLQAESSDAASGYEYYSNILILWLYDYFASIMYCLQFSLAIFYFCFQLFMAKATVQIIDCTIVVNLISLSGKSTVN